jgi:hypothetical protein
LEILCSPASSIPHLAYLVCPEYGDPKTPRKLVCLPSRLPQQLRSKIPGSDPDRGTAIMFSFFSTVPPENSEANFKVGHDCLFSRFNIHNHQTLRNVSS